jgi:catechol 2,3-dioxygenase-like lactoylglutathione lyase family enzyme
VTRLVDARRVLHACWVCDDVDVVTRVLTEGLDLVVTMRTNGGPGDGSVLGFEGTIEAETVFVYDRRGPRTSPAIEVQDWRQPSPTGTPYADPREIGIHAIGVAVPDVASTLGRLKAFGCTPDPHAFSPAGRTVTAPGGVRIDLVEDPTLDESRIHHLRMTCGDLDRSVQWYESIGFGVLDTHESTSSRFARVRLPDEPMALVLVEWLDPPSRGRPYSVANHRGLCRLALGVEDTRGAVAELEASGKPIYRPPQLVELTGTNVPGLWVAFLRDPDGVPVELVERPRSAFR